jgi:hypothetical protein
MFSGWDWIVRSDRVPPAARPHMRAALRRWCQAVACMAAAAITGAVAGGLP